MSLNLHGPHHKIWTMRASTRKSILPGLGRRHRRYERGYALVALLAVMTVIAIFALAAAPSIRQQAQREQEREAIFRGEQIAEAIRVYYSYQRGITRDGPQSLPTSIDQLLEGAQTGRTRKRQVLRASAARDPISESGEWRLIRPAGPEMSDFVREVMLYSENIRPATTDPYLKQQEGFMAPFVIPGSGSGSSGAAASRDDNYTGPFIGVASRGNNNSVIYYYGIARQEGWIFTPLFR
jgi:type II secretory pathway pseudopilin PulG